MLKDWHRGAIKKTFLVLWWPEALRIGLGGKRGWSGAFQIQEECYESREKAGLTVYLGAILADYHNEKIITNTYQLL